MRLTNFGSVVSTYKKNFDLRKKKFIDNRKKIIDEKRKEREDQIEAVKSVEPLIKKINFGKGSKSKNFLGGIQRFLGFALAGFIVSNLKNIIPIIAEVFKKTKEILSGIGKFVSGTIDGLQSFYDASTEKINELNKYVEDFKGIGTSEFEKFETEAGKLLTGVSELARLLTSAALIRDVLGISDTPGSSSLGASGAAALASTRKPPSARIPAPARVPNPAQVRTPAPVRTPVPVRTPAPTPVATPTPKPTAVPAQTRVPVGAGTGTGTGTGKPYHGDLISRTAKPSELLTDAQKRMKLEELDDLTNKSLEAITDDLRKITSNNPQVQEKYIRQMQDKGIRVSDELVGAAGDAAAVRAGALPSEKLVGYTKKFNSAMAAETRLKADLRAQGIEVDDIGEKVFKEVFEDYAEQLRSERRAGFLNRATTSTRTVAQRAATVSMMAKIIKFLRFLGIALGIVSLLSLANEVYQDYQKGDMRSVVVKLSAAGFGALASALAYTAGMAVAGTGVGIVKGGLIIAGAGGIGIGVEESIRRGFLKSPEQSSAKPSTSKLPPLPPTGTLGTGAQAYGAPRAGGTRKHAGVDFDPANDKNSKFYSRIGGEVIFAGDVGGGYGNVVDIYNKELGYTERIAEGNKIHVKVGDFVSPGTLVQSGSEMTGVFHYEIRKGKAGNSGSFEGTVNPLEFLRNLKPSNEVSMRTPASNLISSAGLNQSTTYSEGGVALRREVNNIIIPIAA